jgi:hypothetical protein
LARLEPERPTARHTDDRLERARRLELQSRADRITDGKPEEATAKAIFGFHDGSDSPNFTSKGFVWKNIFIGRSGQQIF